MNAPADEPETPPARDAPAPPRAGRVRVWLLAFLASAAIHLFLIAVYPGLVAPPTVATGPVTPSAETTGDEGMEVVNLVEIPDPPVSEPEEPDAEREPIPVPPRPLAPADEEAAPSEGVLRPDDERRISAARVLRLDPEDIDVRISSLDERVVALSREQIEELLLGDRIYEWLDSMDAAAARAEAARDWTFTDDEGRQWGAKDGRLYLGDIVLPFQIEARNMEMDLEEGIRRRFEVDDIRRGALTGAIRETIEARAKAIRERRDRERKAVQEEREEAARKVVPDSTRASPGRRDAGNGGGPDVPLKSTPPAPSSGGVRRPIPTSESF